MLPADLVSDFPEICPGALAEAATVAAGLRLIREVVGFGMVVADRAEEFVLLVERAVR